jgi:hypothetical protein
MSTRSWKRRFPNLGELVVSETIDNAADTARQRKSAIITRIPICRAASSAPANRSRLKDLDLPRLLFLVPQYIFRHIGKIIGK